MIDKAIAKITDEMMKINEPLVQMIEEHLTSICTTQAVAEKLLNDKKSLKELNQQLWAEANKHRMGNGAWIPDEELLQMSEEYYGITVEDKSSMVAAPAEDIIDISDFL